MLRKMTKVNINTIIKSNACFFTHTSKLSPQNKEFIDKVFNDYQPDSKAKNNLLVLECDLKNRIEDLQHEMNSLKAQYDSVQKEIVTLNAPLAFSEKIKKSIEYMQNIILDAIRKSMLENCREITCPPSWGYDKPVLNLFKPILNAYGISFHITTYSGQGEISESLHFNIPKQLHYSEPVPAHENKEYNKWVKQVVKSINQVAKKTHEMIEKDYLTLMNELYIKIQNGDTNAMTQCKVCQAAFEQFSQFAKENNITVLNFNEIMTAERTHKLRSNNKA